MRADVLCPRIAQIAQMGDSRSYETWSTCRKGAWLRLLAGVGALSLLWLIGFLSKNGILPIAIGFGAGAESRRPMGVAVVGGMLTSTFLTLFVIPIVYVLLSTLAVRVRGVVRDRGKEIED
jgi:Cu/Ag efflux pump CusA